MAEKTSSLTVVTALLGALAALVTALTGLYAAMRDDPELAPTPPPEQVVESEEAAGGVAYERTPWLGIELSQDSGPVRLRSAGGSWSEFDAALAPGPFTLTLTRAADGPGIGVLAWNDASIFECVRDGTLHLPGTGIAGAQFAVPILYLDREGFNYYNPERLKRVAEDKYSIFVSTIASGELELPLTQVAGPLYLIVFRCPDDFSMTVGSHDFERIVLRRD